MKKTPEEKYIEELKEKALLHTVNFEGDMIVGKEQLAKMFKDYATQCQQDNEERKLNMDAETLAIIFHSTYEGLAKQFGYETRVETQQFDKNSNNGKLMIATCEKILTTLNKQ